MTRKLTYGLFLPALLALLPPSAPASPAQARETIAEWVETQRELARERANWQEEKAALDQSIDLLERESRLLDERIGELTDSAGESERAYETLAERNAAYRDSEEETSDLVGQLERQLRGMRPAFPAPLESSAASLFNRLDSSENAPLSRRLQTLLALLGEVNDFQQRVTFSREVHELTDGTRRELQILYVGLAQAFFVDDDARVAGTGHPASSGWEWIRNDSLAGAVSRSVAILENERPAAFVDLPVAVSR